MSSKRIAMYGLIIALAMILSYIESLIPLSFAVPGMKIGLTNIVVVFALYRMKKIDAVIISIIRVIMNSTLFGNAYSFMYSIAGACLSLTAMFLLKKSGRFSAVGVSVGGGICHNLGQILVASMVFETGKLIYYFPALCVSGTVAGIFVGVAAGIITDRIKI